MTQLKLAVTCLGFALALLLFIPREYGGWIGVVTLVVAGTALAITAPTRIDDASNLFQAPPGSETPYRSTEPGLPDPPLRGRHSASPDRMDDDGSPAPQPAD